MVVPEHWYLRDDFKAEMEGMIGERVAWMRTRTRCRGIALSIVDMCCVAWKVDSAFVEQQRSNPSGLRPLGGVLG